MALCHRAPRGHSRHMWKPAQQPACGAGVGTAHEVLSRLSSEEAKVLARWGHITEAQEQHLRSHRHRRAGPSEAQATRTGDRASHADRAPQAEAGSWSQWLHNSIPAQTRGICTDCTRPETRGSCLRHPALPGRLPSLSSASLYSRPCHLSRPCHASPPQHPSVPPPPLRSHSLQRGAPICSARLRNERNHGPTENTAWFASQRKGRADAVFTALNLKSHSSLGAKRNNRRALAAPQQTPLLVPNLCGAGGWFTNS